MHKYEKVRSASLALRDRIQDLRIKELTIEVTQSKDRIMLWDCFAIARNDVIR